MQLSAWTKTKTMPAYPKSALSFTTGAWSCTARDMPQETEPAANRPCRAWKYNVAYQLSAARFLIPSRQTQDDAATSGSAHHTKSRRANQLMFRRKRQPPSRWRYQILNLPTSEMLPRGIPKRSVIAERPRCSLVHSGQKRRASTPTLYITSLLVCPAASTSLRKGNVEEMVRLASGGPARGSGTGWQLTLSASQSTPSRSVSN